MNLEDFIGTSKISWALRISYDHANDLGKGRPSRVRVCVIGTPGCTNAAPFNALYDRVEVTFDPPSIGSFVYDVQRKRANANDRTFVTVGTATTNRFVDPTELAHNVQYAYRVRGLAADGNSEWSRSALVTAVNHAPVAFPDGLAPDGTYIYQVNNKSTLNVSAAQGVLANDTSDDSPLPFRGRRAFLVTGPTAGTLTCGAAGTSPAICEDGSFRYTPPKMGSFEGIVTFTYKADDGNTGLNDQPTAPLSGFSNTVTVSIKVFK